jgi:hypothetical protein
VRAPPPSGPAHRRVLSIGRSVLGGGREPLGESALPADHGDVDDRGERGCRHAAVEQGDRPEHEQPLLRARTFASGSPQRVGERGADGRDRSHHVQEEERLEQQMPHPAVLTNRITPAIIESGRPLVEHDHSACWRRAMWPPLPYGAPATVGTETGPGRGFEPWRDG